MTPPSIGQPWPELLDPESLREELGILRERLRVSQRVAGVGSWEWHVASGQVAWSEELYGIYGVDPRTFVPSFETFLALVHPDDRDRVAGNVADSVRTARPALYEYRCIRPDGGVRSLEARAEVQVNASGRAVRLFGTAQDITDRKAADDDRERAQEIARRGKASSDLLARASHELRTPLNAILGFSDLLEQRLDPSLSPREHRYAQNIHSSGQHLLDLVDRLLEIAKADSGRSELQTSVVALFALVVPVYAEFGASAAAKGVSLDVDLPEASIRVDLERMGRVIRELMANAVSATPSGGSVLVRAAIPDEDLILEVIDSGPGIPEEARSRVFEVFPSIEPDPDATRTGLGLALCRELVELHGGTISFESAPGRTVFRVHLPHVAWRRDDGDRVLIVDDEPNDADLAMTVARDAGLRCEVVGTVSEARAALIRHRPSAVVIDMRLPDGSGNEILEALRSFHPAVPVAVVSAYDDVVMAGTGATWMAKPIDPAELGTWLRRATAAEVLA